MEITRIEFGDADDPESACNQEGYRITISPRGMILVLPNANRLSSEDQDEFEKVLWMAYEQGKRVGIKLTEARVKC